MNENDNDPDDIGERFGVLTKDIKNLGQRLFDAEVAHIKLAKMHMGYQKDLSIVPTKRPSGNAIEPSLEIVLSGPISEEVYRYAMQLCKEELIVLQQKALLYLERLGGN